MHAFQGRVSGGRDIFESTFDEVINVGAVGLDECKLIAHLRLNVSDSSGAEGQVIESALAVAV